MTRVDLPLDEIVVAFLVVSIVTSLLQGHVWCRIQRMEGRETGQRDRWAELLTMSSISTMAEVYRYVFARKYAKVESVWFRRECAVLKSLYIAFFTLFLVLIFAMF
jgi:hypothetical protein